MDLKADFSFRPLPAIAEPVHLPFPNILDPLGPLRELPGVWTGTGFNTIWRPFFPKQPEDEFLELNLTTERIEFAAIGGPIPNRGFFQRDINMFGLTYMQQISDKNVGGGLHAEPGIWATVPATTDPAEPPTVVRMASIPHGTTILAQGQAQTVNGAPVFQPVNINPIPPRGPAVPFPQQNLAHPTPFRSQPPQINGITQAMVDNPNSVLATAIQGQTITSMTVLQVSTHAPAPITGGGTSNTSFLVGGPHGPNADATSVTSTFWIEHVAPTPATPGFLQLQYTQTVMLKFDDGILWPHVTVGTLRKQTPTFVPAAFVDPRMPGELLDRIHDANAPKPAG